jgi:V/A-type H+/Na+-transporting ATPase subunit D
MTPIGADMAPTRAGLLRVRQRLDTARRGFELLDRKRDVLIGEILSTVEEAEGVRHEARDRFAQAYEGLEVARAVMGTERVRRMALSGERRVDVAITPRSVMGVIVPSVRYEVKDGTPTYGSGTSSVVMDQARLDWAAVLELIGRLAEKVTTVWRLSLELRQTQRRLNALEHLYIPMYQEALERIEQVLEEKEREEFYRAKRAKARLEARRAARENG